MNLNTFLISLQYSIPTSRHRRNQSPKLHVAESGVRQLDPYRDDARTHFSWTQCCRVALRGGAPTNSEKRAVIARAQITTRVSYVMGHMLERDRQSPRRKGRVAVGRK